MAMLSLTLSHYLVLAAILFAIAVIGIFLNRKNLIVLLMAIELMLLAVNLNFVAFSYYLGDISGQIFLFFILAVAAAESAIGLAILVVLFRNLSMNSFVQFLLFAFLQVFLEFLCLCVGNRASSAQHSCIVFSQLILLAQQANLLQELCEYCHNKFQQVFLLYLLFAEDL